MASPPLANTLEQGTDGNDVTTTDPGSPNTFDAISGVPPKYTNVQKHSGSLSMRWVSPGSTQLCRFNSLGSLTVDTWFRFYMYLPSLPPDNNFYPIIFRTASDTTCCILRVLSSGIIQMRDPTNSQIGVDGSTAVASGQWVRIEVRVKASATAGEMEYWLYNTADSGTADDHQSVTGQVLAANLDAVGFGINVAYSALTVYYDDVAVSTSGKIGPLVTTLSPSSTVHTRAFGTPEVIRDQQVAIPSTDSVDNSWTDQAGASTLAIAIDETSPSDADYIRSPIDPDNSGCRVKLATLTDPGSSVAHEIHWRPAKDYTGGPQVDMTVKLYQGGGDVLGAGTLIASFSRNNVGAFTSYIETLSGAQADSITNYADLYLEFWANQV